MEYIKRPDTDVYYLAPVLPKQQPRLLLLSSQRRLADAGSWMAARRSALAQVTHLK